MHDRMIGAMFNKAKRSHEQQFSQAGKAINEKVQLYWKIGNALMEARDTTMDPFAAIERIIPWNAFEESVTGAKQLLQSDDFDYLYRISDGYSQIRRYAPAFLEALQMSAIPVAKDILQGIETLKKVNDDNLRRIPASAPTGFVRKRWNRVVFTDEGIDRKFYELCVLSELKNALRSGDIWVIGSRQFKNFDEYLIPEENFTALKLSGELLPGVSCKSNSHLQERLELLQEQLEKVNRIALANELPDAMIGESGLKISPLSSTIPQEAYKLMQQAYKLLPHVKITELLMEVDRWTGFTRHFTHIKSGEEAADKTPLLTAILADGINLGLTKMAESCPGASYAKLSWLQAWHIPGMKHI